MTFPYQQGLNFLQLAPWRWGRRCSLVHGGKAIWQLRGWQAASEMAADIIPISTLSVRGLKDSLSPSTQHLALRLQPVPCSEIPHPPSLAPRKAIFQMSFLRLSMPRRTIMKPTSQMQSWARGRANKHRKTPVMHPSTPAYARSHMWLIWPQQVCPGRPCRRRRGGTATECPAGPPLTHVLRCFH